MDKFIIYTDGASRGNPGPSAAGAAFYNSKKQLVKECSEYLGQGTNNEAEYKAAIFGLEKFKALFGKKKAKNTEVELRTDSKLLAKQINGEFKIKDEKIQPLFVRLWNLRLDFKKAEVVLVPREKNDKADQLANQALDKELNQKKLIE